MSDILAVSYVSSHTKTLQFLQNLCVLAEETLARKIAATLARNDNYPPLRTCSFTFSAPHHKKVRLILATFSPQHHRVAYTLPAIPDCEAKSSVRLVDLATQTKTVGPLLSVGPDKVVKGA